MSCNVQLVLPAVPQKVCEEDFVAPDEDTGEEVVVGSIGQVQSQHRNYQLHNLHITKVSSNLGGDNYSQA